MNFYPFHVGDYASHTRFLTIHQDIAYRRLLDLYYTQEGPIRGSPQQASEDIGMSDFPADVAKILTKFFVSDLDQYGEIWRSVRCDKEIAIYQARVLTAKTNGRTGGRKPKPNPEGTQSVSSGFPESPVDKSDSVDKSSKTTQIEPRPNPVGSYPVLSGFANGTQTEPDGKLTKNQEPIYSVAIATAGREFDQGDLVPPTEKTPIDDATLIFKSGLSILTAAGQSPDAARSFLGKLRRIYGDRILIDAISTAQSETPIEPRGFLQATCTRLQAMASGAGNRPGIRHGGFATVDYDQGVGHDGKF